MLCTIIGLFLKLIGIGISIPTFCKHYKTWKEKQTSKLYEAQHVFIKTGKKPRLGKGKLFLYKWAKMPMDHLWSPDFGPKPIKRPGKLKRAWSVIRRKHASAVDKQYNTTAENKEIA